MTARADLQGSFFLNDGEAHLGVLTVLQEVHTLRTLSPRADTRWHTRDAAGHFHAYSSAEGDKYPTLFQVDLQCASEHLDGEDWWCECRTEYRCRICNALVEPGMKAGEHTTFEPGLKHWEVLLDFTCQECPPPEVGAMVTVEAAMPKATYFGVAVVTSLAVKHPVEGYRDMKVVLAGAGPLGELRKR